MNGTQDYNIMYSVKGKDTMTVSVSHNKQP